MNISCVMIVKNAQKTVNKVLESLTEFDDVVLYDTNSTDDTKKIALSYKNVNFIDGEFIGFGPTKNVAATFAKHKWIFSIDSDEVVSSELLKTIKSLKLNPEFVYGIYRTNFYKEYKIKYSGWSGQVIPRIYHIEKTKYNDKLLHENIITDNLKEQTLSGELEHYSYHNVSDFIEKVELYSTVYADEKAGKKSASLLKAVFSAKFSFIKTYIIKLGFLDGKVGMLIAFSHMATTFYKYIKLIEKNEELKAKS